MDSLPPKPNTLAVSWFFGEFQKETLILKPKYQRNPIWSMGQKCFLIDSLIAGCPIPQVYINIKTQGTGSAKKTFYEVVDGQQRLRSIIEFINDEWPLISADSKGYPFSKAYIPHIGKKYSELPDRLQNSIWDYPIAVQELRQWHDAEIRSMFRRLNYVNERLNKQELRHSQYFGEFNDAVENLAKNAFWDEIGFFSRRDSQRMKDVEFVSELFVIVVDDVQDQQSTLDKFYADYDVVFPKRSSFVAEFDRVLSSLRTIKDVFSTTRFGKKADFYGLFSAVTELNKARRGKPPVDLSKKIPILKKFSKSLEKEPARMTGVIKKYHSTVVEGGNKLSKRKARRDILVELLS